MLRRLSWFMLYACIFLCLASASAVVVWASLQGGAPVSQDSGVPQAVLSFGLEEMAAPVPGEIPAQPTAMPEAPQETSPLEPPVLPEEAAAKPIEVNPNLSEVIEGKTLPKIEGKAEPWKSYAAARDPSDTRPKIAIVVSGLGLKVAITEKAIAVLPSAVSFSFSPYSASGFTLMQRARADGHEVLLDLPMEPLLPQIQDAGPKALLTGSSAEENLSRLQWVMSRGEGYVGLLAMMGGKFLGNDASLRPVLAECKKRGLMFVDNGQGFGTLANKIISEIGATGAGIDIQIDQNLDRGSVEKSFLRLEEIAKSKGFAAGITRPYPLILDEIAAWSKSLESKGIALVPITALAN